MTPDAKDALLAALPPEHDTQEQPPVLAYEPPALVALGNVHALLAAGGNSVSGDGTKGQMRQ